MVVAGRVGVRPDASDEARRQLELRYRLGTDTANAYFDAGFTVVVQDILFGDDLPAYVSRLRRPLHVVVLVARADVIADREAQRPKTAYRDGDYTIDDLDQALRHDTPQIGLWLDNSDQTPDETVDEILARREEALV